MRPQPVPRFVAPQRVPQPVLIPSPQLPDYLGYLSGYPSYGWPAITAADRLLQSAYGFSGATRYGVRP